MDIFYTLVNVEQQTRFLTAYLSEAAAIYIDFGRFKSSLLAASCLLLARVLLQQGKSTDDNHKSITFLFGKELPWPSTLTEATGFTVYDLYQCTLLLYSKW